MQYYNAQDLARSFSDGAQQHHQDCRRDSRGKLRLPGRAGEPQRGRDAGAHRRRTALGQKDAQPAHYAPRCRHLPRRSRRK